MKLLALLLCLLYIPQLSAQHDNLLRNPSFEGSEAKTGQVPLEWYNQGFPNRTPTDLHSSESHFFMLDHKPFEGEIFLGMVTRSNQTWEAIGQKLNQPLEKDSTYIFSVHLARGDSYSSLDLLTRRVADFNIPVKLRVWARNTQKEAFLVVQTPVIEHTNWEKYELPFTAEDDFVEIILEVYYEVSKEVAYNGNLLVDECKLKKK